MKVDADYYRLVNKLMAKAEAMIDSTEEWSAGSLKDMAAILKYLKECKGIKTEADVREQEARIAKLQKEVEADKTDDEKPYGVVIMPPIMGDLIPPKEDNDG